MRPPAESPAPAGPMVPRTAVVLRRSRETADTVTLALKAAGGGAPPRPGQFHMLYVPGVGEAPISVSGLAADGTVLHTLRAVGPVTSALASLRPGDELGLRGPYGSVWPLLAGVGQDVLIVGGGIGLAPLRPLVLALLRDRARYGRIVLLVGARSPGDLLFRRDLARWSSDPSLETRVTVDRADRRWPGRVGVVTTLLNGLALDPGRTTAYLCGPEVMMRLTAAALLGLGLDESALHLSMERNMKCAIGHCGHCQLGPAFVCKDGPVFPYPRMAPLLAEPGL